MTESGESKTGKVFRIRDLAGICVCIAALLAVASARQKSVTVDEYASVPNGLAILKTGAFHIDNQATPLSKVLTALPLLGTSAKFSTTGVPAYTTSWQCGNQFAAENAENYQAYFFAPRIVAILFLLLT